MLKETRLDTASPTGVEGLFLRGNKGCEGHGYVGEIKRGFRLWLESQLSCYLGRKSDLVFIVDGIPWIGIKN